MKPSHEAAAADDALWYKDALIYQLHVRSFYDSNGDGVGDFRGLTQKLDYLQDLGVTTLWLLPFYPSPLRDDGYDIADYTGINPAYGTLKDFKEFVSEAHRHGLRVVTELVINHTSDQHPWFERARKAKPGSAHRNFYVWSDTLEKYADARIIFKDFEPSNWSWDPLSKQYYWHRFFSHQPDLNFDSPIVRETILKLFDFWLDLGVDGLRLDAIPYLFEREGTNCENLPQTHEFLKVIRRRVDGRYHGRMLLAEANQWPEDAIAYFGAGDECHAAFHFPVMPRLYMALHMEDRFPILDILQQTPPIPHNCQWMIFLRNHDELTLEMVTDEERDYMYRAYAHDRQARINLGIRRRLAPLLGNNRARIQLMNGLLFSLPGTPVIYYGDEIGMGDNIYLGDRHGVRTPMQWTPDRNAGFSAASSQRLYSPVIVDGEYAYATVNVELQQKNPHSLFWWMKRLIAVRQNYPAFGRGDFRPLLSNNPKVLSFTRQYEGQTMLVVANLSRFTQFVELDLSPFAPCRPVEVFGRTRLPGATASPYPLTLAPHVFHWFLLECQPESPRLPLDTRKFMVTGDGFDIFQGRNKTAFESLLTRQLPDKSWFADKSRFVTGVRIDDVVPMSKRDADSPLVLLLLRVEYRDGEPGAYLLLAGVAWGDAAAQILERSPETALAHLRVREHGREGILYDASADQNSRLNLLEIVRRERHVRGSSGAVVGSRNEALLPLVSPAVRSLADGAVPAQAAMVAAVFDDCQILKLYRRIEPGAHPELEIGSLLGNRALTGHVPRLLGSIEYRRGDDDPTTLAVVQEFDPQARSARQLTQDWVSRFSEAVLALPEERQTDWMRLEKRTLWQMAEATPPEAVKELLAGFLDHCLLLGQRLAEFHLAIAASDDARYAPERFSKFFQRSSYQTARKLLLQTFEALKGMRSSLPEDAHGPAGELLGKERELLEAFRAILQSPVSALRIRCHGSLNLGQVFFTGKDFVFSEFEHVLGRSHAKRRIKCASLADLAGLVYSLHTVAVKLAPKTEQFGVHTAHASAVLHQALETWYRWSSSALFKGYLEAVHLPLPLAGEGPGVGGYCLVPKQLSEREVLLRFYLLERAVSELADVLSRDPANAAIRLGGVLELLAM